MDTLDIIGSVVGGVVAVAAVLFAVWLVALATYFPEVCLWAALGVREEYFTFREIPWWWRTMASLAILATCLAHIVESDPDENFPFYFVDYVALLAGTGALVWGSASAGFWLAFLLPRLGRAVARRYAERRERVARERREQELRAAAKVERRRREEQEAKRHAEYLADAPARAAREAAAADRARAEREREARLRAEAEAAAVKVRREEDERRRRESAAAAEVERERKRAWDAAPKDRRCTHCGLRYPLETAAACIRCGRSDGQEVVLAGG